MFPILPGLLGLSGLLGLPGLPGLLGLPGLPGLPFHTPLNLCSSLPETSILVFGFFRLVLIQFPPLPFKKKREKKNNLI